MPYQVSDLARLSPHDFELLVRDLAQSRLGVEFESFASGRDGGVDLRSVGADRSIVIQCKRYIDSAHSTLLAAVRDESDNVAKLAPDHYVLASARRATDGNKRELEAAVAGWAPTVEVWTGHDVVRYLDDDSDLAGRHPKLWLPASSVLRRLLQAEATSRTSEFLREARDELPIFVTSDVRAEAIQKLNSERVVILSGDPGVGKTSLAKSLALEAAAKEVEVHLLARDVREGFSLMDEQRQQLFVFDDFLGKSKLTDLLGRNEGSDLARFVSAARRSGQTQLVLTTRDYVLNAAITQDEALSTLEGQLDRVVVRVADYNDWTRARILYNHLFYSDLPKTALSAFVEQRTYRKTIAHRYYNPRLVAALVELALETGVEPEAFPEYFLDSLDDPSRLWSEVFHRHLGVRERVLLAVMKTSGEKSIAATRERWKAVVGELESTARATNLAFQDSLKILEPTFVGVIGLRSVPTLTFANPGVEDVASALLCDHEAIVEACFRRVERWDDFEAIEEWSSPRGRRGDFIELEPFADVLLRQLRLTVASGSSRLSGLVAVATLAVLKRLGASLGDVDGLESAFTELARGSPLDELGSLLQALTGIGATDRVESLAVSRALDELSVDIDGQDELELAAYLSYRFPAQFDGVRQDIETLVSDLVDYALEEAVAGNLDGGLDEMLVAADELGYQPDDELVAHARQAIEWEPEYDPDDRPRSLDPSRGGDEIDRLFWAL